MDWLRDSLGPVYENEAANLVNPNATARKLSDARVPIYYWGPPNDDYIMNDIWICDSCLGWETL